MVNTDLQKLVGKTVKSIIMPSELTFTKDNYYHKENVYSDACILLTFTDGTQWKLASWDYEDYSSGIKQEIIEG